MNQVGASTYAFVQTMYEASNNNYGEMYSLKDSNHITFTKEGF